MQRDLQQYLIEWKTSADRLPLLLRGARQVGKSWLARELGKTFQNYFEVNFEEVPEAKKAFENNLGPQLVLEQLALFFSQKITPGDSLLFLDEIQACPKAITALRYFKEKCPELHIVAAGSLLDFELEKIGIPVGRVEFCYVHPLSFGEFLAAVNQPVLREAASVLKQNAVAHDLLMDQLKMYLWLGGMPAVINAWMETKDPRACQRRQDIIVANYIEDFNKYAKQWQIANCETVFKAIPQQLGRKFVYSHVEAETSHHQIKTALQLLIKAGVALPCLHSAGQGVPLGAQTNPNRFKVFFFDVGLALRILGLELRDWMVADVSLINKGAVAEQFVAQEVVAATARSAPPQLFYWHREDGKGNAEVDFLFTRKQKVVPVEVKAGLQGGLKSLHVFLQAHLESPQGLKIAARGFGCHRDYEEIPLYSVAAWLGEKDGEIETIK